MKTTLVLLASVILLPMASTSCSTRTGSAVAGAATYGAIKKHRDDEKKEDYINYKHVQNKKRGR